MSEYAELGQIRRRVFQLTTFEDGLWDMLLGLIFMLLALYPVSRELLGPEWNFVLFVVLLGVAVGLQLVVRRTVSMPRIGFAAPLRSPKLRLLLITTLVLVLATFGLVALTLLSPEAGVTEGARAVAGAARGYGVEFAVVVVMGGLFSAMGYLFGVGRLYLYGWMIGLANLASVYQSHNAGWILHVPTAIAAGIILLIGTVRLVRFLRSYPVRTEGSQDVS